MTRLNQRPSTKMQDDKAKVKDPFEPKILNRETFLAQDINCKINCLPLSTWSKDLAQFPFLKNCVEKCPNALDKKSGMIKFFYKTTLYY